MFLFEIQIQGKYRVGQDNLPIWPMCTKIVHNYLFSASILITILAHVHVTSFMLVLKNCIIKTNLSALYLNLTFLFKLC
jgi:hypothetical protein